MSRVPKGVVPGVNVPDPERWLKKSERSTYGQGKRRKGPAGGGATQGSVESAAASAPVKSSKTAVKNKGKKK
jgi:signal recognition particle subunit SRP72